MKAWGKLLNYFTNKCVVRTGLCRCWQRTAYMRFIVVCLWISHNDGYHTGTGASTENTRDKLLSTTNVDPITTNYSLEVV